MAAWRLGGLAAREGLAFVVDAAANFVITATKPTGPCLCGY